MTNNRLQVFNLDDITHTEMRSKNTDQPFAHSSLISVLFDFKKIFVDHEILLPGRRASLPHVHSKKEEMVLVLSGTLTAHVGAASAQLRPGDFIGFAPKSEPHYLENLSDSEARFLLIASNHADDLVKYV